MSINSKSTDVRNKGVRESQEQHQYEDRKFQVESGRQILRRKASNLSDLDHSHTDSQRRLQEGDPRNNISNRHLNILAQAGRMKYDVSLTSQVVNKKNSMAHVQSPDPTLGRRTEKGGLTSTANGALTFRTQDRRMENNQRRQQSISKPVLS